MRSSADDSTQCCCYLRLWWMHRIERRRATAFRSAMDLSDLGIAVLDRRGRLIFKNRSVERLLYEADGLVSIGATVGCAVPNETHRLQAAQQTAIARNRGSNEPATRMTGAMLSLQRKARRSLILTLVAVEKSAVGPDDPAVILYVLDPEYDVRAMLSPAYRIYGLTITESRLVSELVTGATLSEAAGVMNLRLHTVRSYLKHVFLKTETNRQTELIRLMLASAARPSVGMDLRLM